MSFVDLSLSYFESFFINKTPNSKKNPETKNLTVCNFRARVWVF